jgi:hypothetical protein
MNKREQQEQDEYDERGGGAPMAGREKIDDKADEDDRSPVHGSIPVAPHGDRDITIDAVF